MERKFSREIPSHIKLIKQCPNCGNECDAAYAFCPECQFELSEDDEPRKRIITVKQHLRVLQEAYLPKSKTDVDIDLPKEKPQEKFGREPTVTPSPSSSHSHLYDNYCWKCWRQDHFTRDCKEPCIHCDSTEHHMHRCQQRPPLFIRRGYALQGM